jgi:hypothetical protein
VFVLERSEDYSFVDLETLLLENLQDDVFERFFPARKQISQNFDEKHLYTTFDLHVDSKSLEFLSVDDVHSALQQLELLGSDRWRHRIGH